jgi:peptide deformylase
VTATGQGTRARSGRSIAASIKRGAASILGHSLTTEKGRPFDYFDSVALFIILRFTRRSEFVVRVIHYPHPTLFRKSQPLRRVDAELRSIVAEMFDLMYQNKGIGLAANQVDLPYRLFVMNVEGDPQQPEHERVFINPVLSKPKGSEEKEEGCLSLPGLYADVRRPATVHVSAYDLTGQEIALDADGLMARCIQHETDHLDGVMFIDRLSPTAVMDIKDKLDDFRREFEHRRELGEIPGDAKIFATLAELEKLRC